MVNPLLLKRLLEARRTRTLIENVSDDARLDSLDDAYATSDALAHALGKNTVGWKIGAATERGQRALGLSEPFGGRIFHGTVLHSPARLQVGEKVLTIGAEFVLRIARDLNAAETFDAETVRVVIDAIHPALELNHPNFREPMTVGGLYLIADNGVGIGLVLGDEIKNWRARDLHSHMVSLDAHETQHRGCAHDIGFDAFAALAWLANDRAKRGAPLRAGDLISSGDLVGAIEAGANTRVVGEFGDFGMVELALEE